MRTALLILVLTFLVGYLVGFVAAGARTGRTELMVETLGKSTEILSKNGKDYLHFRCGDATGIWQVDENRILRSPRADDRPASLPPDVAEFSKDAVSAVLPTYTIAELVTSRGPKGFSKSATRVVGVVIGSVTGFFAGYVSGEWLWPGCLDAGYLQELRSDLTWKKLEMEKVDGAFLHAAWELLDELEAEGAGAGTTASRIAAPDSDALLNQLIEHESPKAVCDFDDKELESWDVTLLQSTAVRRMIERVSLIRRNNDVSSADLSALVKCRGYLPNSTDVARESSMRRPPEHASYAAAIASLSIVLFFAGALVRLLLSI
jgi:hypothetical protein